jgi:predicted Fe-Mo cluster-binding NifX family protein
MGVCVLFSSNKSITAGRLPLLDVYYTYSSLTDTRSLMSKIGVMMSAECADGPMSSHFGKAEWMMIVEPDKSGPEFVKNDGMNGKSAVEIAIRQGCTDVIFTEIGNGAFGHLKAANIRGWVAPEDITGFQAYQMFEQSKLRNVDVATKQAAGHGCCCASRDGSDAPSCCRG